MTIAILEVADLIENRNKNQHEQYLYKMHIIIPAIWHLFDLSSVFLINLKNTWIETMKSSACDYGLFIKRNQ